MAARKGLVAVLTGDGKGKTSAAFGMALRALGHGMRVHVIQFIKADETTGERAALTDRFPEVEVIQAGLGFVPARDHPDFDRHRTAAAEALALAGRAVSSGDWDMVILDEVVCAESLGLIGEEDLLALVASRPERVHLVLTGRGASCRLIEAADLVTEMHDVRHHQRDGTQAQEGIEF